MTSTHDVALFVAGALAAGYAIAALAFLSFWRQTRDRLFALFASAFALLLVQRVALALVPAASLSTVWYYMLRLLAFTLILVAIVDKNRGSAR